MNVELSDLLTCPRCGPTYGLVLLPYESEDRRVRSGVLGCANCRERYAIEGGVADLRVGDPDPDPDRESDPDPEGEPPAEPAVRLAGLLGLAEARGAVLVAGPEAARAADLSALVEGVEVVAVTDREPGVGPGEAGGGGVSRVRIDRVIPFRSGSLRGVALTGGWSSLVEEGARVLGREGRLVLAPSPVGVAERLAEAGLRVVAAEAGVVVAVRSP
ncbi:MAG: hypothetical protein R6U63_09290 [Longimicrobiales bacterium]